MLSTLYLCYSLLLSTISCTCLRISIVCILCILWLIHLALTLSVLIYCWVFLILLLYILTRLSASLPSRFLFLFINILLSCIYTRHYWLFYFVNILIIFIIWCFILLLIDNSCLNCFRIYNINNQIIRFSIIIYLRLHNLGLDSLYLFNWFLLQLYRRHRHRINYLWINLYLWLWR